MSLQFEEEGKPQQAFSQRASETVEAETAAASAPISSEERFRIGKLLRRIRKRNPIKAMAWNVLLGVPLQETDFYTLEKALSNVSANRWAERQLAVWILGREKWSAELQPLALYKIGETLEKAHKRDRKRALVRSFWRSGFYPTAFAMSFTIIGYTLRTAGLREYANEGERLLAPLVLPFAVYYNFFARWSEPLFRIHSGNIISFVIIFAFILFSSLAIGSAPLLAPLSLYFDRKRQVRVRQEAISALESQGDPEAVGVLAASWRDAAPAVKQRLQRALHTLLPKLTSEHCESLRSDTTPNLCYILLHCDALLLHVNILEALEKVGDSRAVKPLERYIKAAHAEEIRAKAQAVLQVVATREPRQDHAGVLLRAANEPTNAEKELLRPASGTDTTPPEQLLRPALGNEDP